MPRVNVQWERQEGEPTLWYSRFWEYCKLGPSRTAYEVYKKDLAEKAAKESVATGKEVKSKPSPRTPPSWSEYIKKFRWNERAFAWDDDQIRAERERHERDVRETRKKHRDYGRILQTVALKKLAKVEPSELSPAVSSAMLQDGIKVELTSLGEPESITEQRSKDLGGVKEYSEQELEDELTSLRSRIRQAEEAEGTQSGAGEAGGTPADRAGGGSGGVSPDGGPGDGESPAPRIDKPA